jgi:hypothetical protein
MAESLLRVAFVNQSRDTSVTIRVVTQDTVESCELLATTPAALPEQASGTLRAPGGFDLEVPAGRILGFVTKSEVTITNPNSAIVTTVYANGKDPWPQPPPPPPPPFAAVADFDTRYSNFLLGGGAPSNAPRPVIMVLSPA